MSLQTINRKEKEQKSFFRSFLQEKQETRQWLLVSLLSLAFLFVFAISARAQSWTISNPGEYVILGETSSMLQNEVTSQTKYQAGTAVLQDGISFEFQKIKNWQKQYNKYLKKAEGFASAIKAATHIYNDGLKILITLNNLRLAARNNPQGVVATLSMNNLYIETFTEFVCVGMLLKYAVATGGSANMLTGAERAQTLWQLEDRLSRLSRRLQLLFYSIRHYKMVDVWNSATAGIVRRSKKELALQSLSHWTRFADETGKYKE